MLVRSRAGHLEPKPPVAGSDMLPATTASSSRQLARASRDPVVEGHVPSKFVVSLPEFGRHSLLRQGGASKGRPRHRTSRRRVAKHPPLVPIAVLRNLAFKHAYLSKVLRGGTHRLLNRRFALSKENSHDQHFENEPMIGQGIFDHRAIGPHMSRQLPCEDPVSDSLPES